MATIANGAAVTRLQIQSASSAQGSDGDVGTTQFQGASSVQASEVAMNSGAEGSGEAVTSGAPGSKGDVAHGTEGAVDLCIVHSEDGRDCCNYVVHYLGQERYEVKLMTFLDLDLGLNINDQRIR